ncbi:hypothetical protein CRG98_011568 [Punica granatum]|uniref:Uncharacterized protein n=1 Tax=Punica granatum TaxID=22663 RepID=A0A2I0KHG3_PUNGR|nr:hypothetical protein CRG98_011568 [Punica granatum]
MPTPSVEGLRLPIGGPNSKSTGDFDSGSSVDSGSGPPIGEGAATLGGGVGVSDWRPRPQIVGTLTRGRGRQLTIPTPPSRSPASSVGAGALGGWFGVADWRPRLPPPLIFLYRIKMKQNEKLRI